MNRTQWDLLKNSTVVPSSDVREENDDFGDFPGITGTKQVLL